MNADPGAEWRNYLGRLAAYTPLPAERIDTPDPRIILWAFAGRALIIEPPEVAAPLGLWSLLWYAARRDANLLQRCPISDSLAQRLLAEPFPGRAA
jgi:hypothetical protein